MKKRTKKIGGTLTRILMALIVISSWAVLGVALALKSANVQMSGSISFKATEIFADITGSVSGTATTNTLGDIHIKSDTTQEQINSMATGWGNMTLDFTNANLITVTVNITNKAKDRAVWVSLTDEIDETNLTMTRQVTTYTWNDAVGAMNDNHTTVTGKFRDAIKVEPAVEIMEGVVQNGSATIEITMSVADLNASIDNTNFGLGITLSNEEPKVADASEYDTLSFTYNDDAKTASVSANSSNKPTGDLVIPAKVMHEEEIYEVTGTAFMNSFSGCAQLTSVTIPASIGSLGIYAFSGCTSLAHVNLSEGLTSIGVWSFSGCSSLTSIIIPASVTQIGGDAFQSCSSLENITVNSSNTVLSSYENGVYEGTELVVGCKNTIIKDDTTSIGGSAFSGCTELTSISIPSNVTSIGMSAFQGCTQLTSITIPSNVTDISMYVFKDCSNLTSIIFENPNGWKENGETISSEELSDSSKAAKLLKGSVYIWTRSDS